jgi:uncharacterized DUF497 family protein
MGGDDLDLGQERPMPPAGFEWDPAKETRNIVERGLDFTTASRIWDGPVVEQVDQRRDYGETRSIATGLTNGSILVVVYTWRGGHRRIISARKANSRERQRFQNEIAGRAGRLPN